jgi:hypothetical protein
MVGAAWTIDNGTENPKKRVATYEISVVIEMVLEENMTIDEYKEYSYDYMLKYKNTNQIFVANFLKINTSQVINF